MKRPHLLGLGLFAVLVATWWSASLEEVEGNETRKPTSRAKPRKTGPTVDLSLLENTRKPFIRETSGDTPKNLFPIVSFQPPPPPPPPTPKPMAPPLPFRYTGMLEEGDKTIAFLTEGEQVRLVRAGDVLDGRYRVITVLRTQIDFIYLPLGEPQTLATGTPP